MLVRAGDGEWLQLRPVGGMPPGGFRSVCGHDAANLLELDDPMPVVKFGDEGDRDMVDAICLTHDGGIALLAATFGEEPRDTLWRLLNIAGMLRGMSLEVFAANCAEVQGASPAEWLAELVGGDARALESRMAHVLETGAFELVLVTPAGPGELATPMRFLQAGSANVRAYEVEILRAGEVQAIEGIEITLDGERAEGAPPRRLELVEPMPEPEAEVRQPEPAQETAAPAPAPEPEPTPEPLAEVEPEPEVVEELAAEATPEPQPEPAAETPFWEAEPADVGMEEHSQPEAEAEAPAAPVAEEAPLGEPSTEEAFIAAIDRLDHRSSALMRFLHGRLLTFVGEREYTKDANLEYFVGWTQDAPSRPLVGLDSAGAFTVVLSSLPQEEQAEYAAELAGLQPEGDAAKIMELGVAELSVLEHLNDETLLEYVIDNFAEALPGGRAAFEEAAAAPVDEDDDRDEESAGDDFFAGVSGDHEPDEIAQVVGSEPEQEQPAAEAAPEPTPEPAKPEPRGGFARRLRRRDAA